MLGCRQGVEFAFHFSPDALPKSFRAGIKALLQRLSSISGRCPTNLNADETLNKPNTVLRLAELHTRFHHRMRVDDQEYRLLATPYPDSHGSLPSCRKMHVLPGAWH
jgi:hypothetical protein